MITAQEFSLKLQENMMALWFDIDSIQEELGMGEMPKMLPGDEDMPDPELCDRIAHYLIEVEELGNADESNDHMGTALLLGKYIYAWEQEKAL